MLDTCPDGLPHRAFKSAFRLLGGLTFHTASNGGTS